MESVSGIIRVLFLFGLVLFISSAVYIKEGEAQSQDLEARVAELEKRIAELEKKIANPESQVSALSELDPYVKVETVAGVKNIVFEGVNVQIRNGKGTTAKCDNSGLGNLIVGVQRESSGHY